MPYVKYASGSENPDSFSSGIHQQGIGPNTDIRRNPAVESTSIGTHRSDTINEGRLDLVGISSQVHSTNHDRKRPNLPKRYRSVRNRATFVSSPGGLQGDSLPDIQSRIDKSNLISGSQITTDGLATILPIPSFPRVRAHQPFFNSPPLLNEHSKNELRNTGNGFRNANV
ncbi:unnamed protein product [Allacma fusca]|uniref:Uncharacterized protein n=1 Tax=Allacma fusca TaxID=39272 RepID=A0A8J2LKU4_9HEXA|nr:unnamed protein product [Allacma fusca]